jgi:hypothetical protein
MLHTSYEIWLVAITVLMCGWCLLRDRRQPGCRLNRLKSNPSRQDHDIDHQALICLMAQKNDSMLAALAKTIDQERQKLGTVVRKSSIPEAHSAFQTDAQAVSDDPQSSYEQILPMAHDGITASKIARRLDLPEAEVSMVMRLKAV